MSEELPSGWAWQELSNVASINMGQSPPSESYSDLADMGLPFFQGCGDFGNRTPSPKIYCRTPLKIAEKDSILISVRAPVGVMNRADRRSCIGRGLAAISGTAADTDFLNHSVSYFRSSLSRLAQGTTFEAIGSSELNGLRLPLPPLPTQRRIAAVLRTVDEVIEATEARIEKQQAIKQGLLHDLFTRGVTPDGQLRPPPTERPDLYQETELGLIPNEWEVVELENCLESAVDGPFGSNLKTEHYRDEGVRVVRLQNIGDNGCFNDSDKVFVDERHASFLQRHQVLAGDVLVASLGDENHPLGRACIYPQSLAPGIVKADCFRLRFSPEKAMNSFVMNFLNCPAYRFEIAYRGQGVTRDRVNLSNLKQVRVPLPEVSEQRASTEHLGVADKKLALSTASLMKLRQLKSALMQDLLTGRVSAAAIDLDEVLPD